MTNVQNRSYKGQTKQRQKCLGQDLSRKNEVQDKSKGQKMSRTNYLINH